MRVKVRVRMRAETVLSSPGSGMIPRSNTAPATPIRIRVMVRVTFRVRR